QTSSASGTYIWQSWEKKPSLVCVHLGQPIHCIDLHDNQLTSSSLILSYPSPPSKQESSSIRVGFDSSESTHLESQLNSNENWPKILPTVTQDSGWDELGLLGERSDWPLSSAYSRPESMSLTSHIRTTSSLSSPFTLPLSTSPQLPFHLPFISFLLSFLTIDESIPHLNLEDDEEPPHGALKLLLSNPDKSQNTTEFDQDTSLAALEGLVEGGVMAWKEVKAWNAGDARSLACRRYIEIQG
ncbi:hypothetical protein JB92DRAFT_2850255, partial [Gautieria morchelliformis]